MSAADTPAILDTPKRPTPDIIVQMPNHTDIPRCMVAMVHSPAWLGNKIRLKLPENVRPMIESFKSPIRYSAEYVDPKGFDHLSLEFNYDPCTSRSSQSYSRSCSLLAMEPSR